MVIDVWDIPKRRHINVEPFTQSVSTFHMSDDEISDLIHSEHACEGIRSSLASGNLPSKTVLRHKAYQIVSQEDDVEVTSWVDPDLNCLPLEKTEVFSSGAKNAITVLKIVEGEPPDSMFKPPAGYTERSPAQVETVYEKMFAGKELYPKRWLSMRSRSITKAAKSGAGGWYASRFNRWPCLLTPGVGE